MHQRVIEVHKIVKSRGQRTFNAKLNDAEVDKYCTLDEEAEAVLQRAIMKFSLSFRAIKKVQRVSRTIADLDYSIMIEKRHILEALSYRRRG